MRSRLDFLVTTRGEPDKSRKLLVNGRRLELPSGPDEVFKLPEGEEKYGEDILEVPSLSLLFSVFDLKS